MTGHATFGYEGTLSGCVNVNPMTTYTFVVEGGSYVSARLPGDAYLFARRFAALLDGR